MGDKIVVMNHGVVEQFGTPQDIYDKPATTFVASFIGSPAMNMIPATVAGGQVQIDGGAHIDLGTPMGGDRKVTLGIRPEDLEPVSGPALISGSVNVREPLGHETLIHVGTAHGDIIAKADGRTPPELGKTVNLGAQAHNIHVFDPESGAALR